MQKPHAKTALDRMRAARCNPQLKLLGKRCAAGWNVSCGVCYIDRGPDRTLVTLTRLCRGSEFGLGW